MVGFGGANGAWGAFTPRRGNHWGLRGIFTGALFFCLVYKMKFGCARINRDTYCQRSTSTRRGTRVVCLCSPGGIGRIKSGCYYEPATTGNRVYGYLITSILHIARLNYIIIIIIIIIIIPMRCNTIARLIYNNIADAWMEWISYI